MPHSLKVIDPNMELLVSVDDQLSLLRPLQKETYLDSIFIAGVTWLDDPQLICTLKTDQEIVLIREDNPHDALAIRLQTSDGQKLGYIPRRKNAIFSRLMDSGHLLKGKVELTEKRGALPVCKAGIYMVEF